MDCPGIAALLRSKRFVFDDELELQDRIEDVLGDAARREVTLSAGGRIDFMVGSIGIEVKIAGSGLSVARQLQGYAQSSELTELILVTTLRRHHAIASLKLGRPVDGGELQVPVHVLILPLQL